MKDLYDTIGIELESEMGIERSKMFGAPCLKTGKKAFAVFSKNIMAFKVGAEEVKFLLDQYPGSVNWDPSGKNKPMKDWLHVPKEYHADWKSLAVQAEEYVRELNN